MEALGRSCLKLSPCNHRGANWSTEFALCRQETGFLVYQKRGRTVGFSLSVSSGQKYNHSISPASSSSDIQETVESEEIQIDQRKTVHIRFKLQKECVFGQKFLIVGDDAIVGSWDPSGGLSLNWSEGHLWTAELNIPIGKVIKYKVILQGETGTILWQPGPDRILETWDTQNTITVFENWDNPELRNILEEEEIVADLNTESLIDSDLLAVAENFEEPEEGTDLKKEFDNSNGHLDIEEKTSAPMVAENITLVLGEQDSSTTDQKNEAGEGDSAVNASDLFSPEDEILVDEEVPVLVPGLLPMLPEEIEEASPHEEERIDLESKSSIISSQEVEPNTPELKDEEHVSASLSPAETIEEMIDKNQETYGREEVGNDILEGDVQWGRRTLQKFLATLGFQTS